MAMARRMWKGVDALVPSFGSSRRFQRAVDGGVSGQKAPGGDVPLRFTVFWITCRVFSTPARHLLHDFGYIKTNRPVFHAHDFGEFIPVLHILIGNRFQ